MGQSTDLMDALKAELRGRKITYKDLARHLGMAESSVKRSFASGQLTLGRLEAICDFAEIEYARLVHGRATEQKLLSQLTEAQEAELVVEPAMFLVAASLMNLISCEDILKTYQLTEAEVVGYMVRLDRVGFIKLFPNNRYRLLLARTFGWLPNGPMMQFFKDHAHEFLASNFGKHNEMLVLLNARLTPAHLNSFMDRLRRLARDFSDQHIEDAEHPLSDRQPLSLLIAARPWHMQYMVDLLRAKESKPQPKIHRA